MQAILEKELNKDKTTIKVKETKNADNNKYTVTEIITNTDKAGIKEMADKIKKYWGLGRSQCLQAIPTKSI